MPYGTLRGPIGPCEAHQAPPGPMYKISSFINPRLRAPWNHKRTNKPTELCIYIYTIYYINPL